MKRLVKIRKEQIEILPKAPFFSRKVKAALFATLVFHALFFTLFRIRFPDSAMEEMTQLTTNVSIVMKKKTELSQQTRTRPSLSPRIAFETEEEAHFVHTLPLKMEVPIMMTSSEEEPQTKQPLFSLQGDLATLEIENEQFCISETIAFPTQVQLIVNSESGQVLFADSENLSDDALLEIAKGIRFKKTHEKSWINGTLEILP